LRIVTGGTKLTSINKFTMKRVGRSWLIEEQIIN
jgi:hypothetical protein